MKLLPPRIHGIFDYVTAATFAGAPVLFTLGHSTVPIVACYVMAGTLFVVSLLTRYPLGVAKIIPFPVHGAIEVVSAVGLVALPWLTGFADQPGARTFFVAAGLMIFTLWLLTDYRAAERGAAANRES